MALAQLMGNQGEIVALDRRQIKVDALRKLASLLAATCIKTHR